MECVFHHTPTHHGQSPQPLPAEPHADATARLLALFSPDDLLVRKLLAVCPPSRPPSPGVSYCLDQVHVLHVLTATTGFRCLCLSPQAARPAANSWKRRDRERTIAQQNLELYSRWEAR